MTSTLTERLRYILPKRETIMGALTAPVVEPPEPAKREYPVLRQELNPDGQRKVGRPRMDPNWTAQDIRRHYLEGMAERYKRRRAKQGKPEPRPYRMRESSL